MALDLLRNLKSQLSGEYRNNLPTLPVDPKVESVAFSLSLSDLSEMESVLHHPEPSRKRHFEGLDFAEAEKLLSYIRETPFRHFVPNYESVVFNLYSKGFNRDRDIAHLSSKMYVDYTSSDNITCAVNNGILLDRLIDLVKITSMADSKKGIALKFLTQLRAIRFMEEEWYINMSKYIFAKLKVQQIEDREAQVFIGESEQIFRKLCTRMLQALDDIAQYLEYAEDQDLVVKDSERILSLANIEMLRRYYQDVLEDFDIGKLLSLRTLRVFESTIYNYQNSILHFLKREGVISFELRD